MNVIHGTSLALHSYQKAMDSMDFSAAKSSKAAYVAGTDVSNGSEAKAENGYSPLTKPVPDVVSISPEAQARAESDIRKAEEKDVRNSQDKNQDDNAAESEESASSIGQNAKKPDGTQLTDAEQAVVDDMKARDQEVRVHEEQHKATGGQYASSPSYSYETGPDGKKYITDGEVQISVSKEDTPEKTIAKMQQVQRAALAPQEPSGQDRKVAAEAAMKEAEARRELAEETSGKTESKDDTEKSQETANSENAEKTADKDDSSKKDDAANMKDLSSENRGFARMKRAYGLSSGQNTNESYGGFRAVA